MSDLADTANHYKFGKASAEIPHRGPRMVVPDFWSTRHWLFHHCSWPCRFAPAGFFFFTTFGAPFDLLSGFLLPFFPKRLLVGYPVAAAGATYPRNFFFTSGSPRLAEELFLFFSSNSFSLRFKARPSYVRFVVEDPPWRFDN